MKVISKELTFLVILNFFLASNSLSYTRPPTIIDIFEANYKGKLEYQINLNRTNWNEK